MTTSFVLLILTFHFVADFLLQNDWMALHKSKRWDALLAHVSVYTLTFFVVLFGIGWWAQLPTLFAFAAVTFAAHFVTDAATSRITSALWFIPLLAREKADVAARYGAYPYLAYVRPTRHWFFVVIGLDQLLHYLQLFLTAHWLGIVA